MQYIYDIPSVLWEKIEQWTFFFNFSVFAKFYIRHTYIYYLYAYVFIYVCVFVGIYGTRVIANDLTLIQNYKYSATAMLGGINLYLILWLGHRYLQVIYKRIKTVTHNMPV